MAGYSGTPLAQKLGIGVGARVLVVSAPAEFAAALGEVPDGVELTSSTAGKRPFDVAVVFVTRRADVAGALKRVSPRLTPAGGLWFAWPKRSSGVETDVTEDVLRALVLPTGWVDNKVCAVDERWSGLRFVLRKELRPRGTSAPKRGSTPRTIQNPGRAAASAPKARAKRKTLP